MMNKNIFIFIAVIGITRFVPVQGETIECYKGVKKANGEGKIETTECPDGVTQCIKEGNGHGTDLYSLSDTSTLYNCGCKPDQQDGCVKKDDDKPEYCVCTGDLC